MDGADQPPSAAEPTSTSASTEAKTTPAKPASTSAPETPPLTPAAAAENLIAALAPRPLAALVRFVSPSARSRLVKSTKRRIERAQRPNRRSVLAHLRESLRRGWLATPETDLHDLAPIHAAAMCGRRTPAALDIVLRAVATLPRRERDLNLRDANGLSPLSHAVMANWGDGVRKLVTAGADVTAPFCDKSVKEWERVPGDLASLLSFAVFLNSMDAFHALVDCGARPSDWDRSGMRPVHIAVLCGNIDAVRDLVARDGALGELDRSKAVELYTVREKYIKPASEVQVGQGDDDDELNDGNEPSEPIGDDSPMTIPHNGDEIDDNDEDDSNGPPWGFESSANPHTSRDFYRSLTADLDGFDVEDHAARHSEINESDPGNITQDDGLGMTFGEIEMEDDEDIGTSEDEDESLPDLAGIEDADEEMPDVAETEEANAQDAAIAQALLGVLQGALKHALARAEKRRKAGAQSAGTSQAETKVSSGKDGEANGDNEGDATNGEPSFPPPQEPRETIFRGADGDETHIMQMGDVMTVQHMPGNGVSEDAENESEGTRIYMNMLRAVYLALNAYRKEFYGATLLHLAARQKHHDVMRFLLESAPFAQAVSDRQNDGLTALHVAAEVDDPVAIELLLAAGADINARSDTESTTALMLASNRGLKNTVKILLERGARVSDENDEGSTALHYASASDKGEEVISLLVEAGADINAQTVEGNTPVYTSVAQNHSHFKVFQKLLELGGDPSISNHDGSVPLAFIATKGMKELTSFAEFVAKHPRIKEKIDMDSTIGNQDQTALHMAADEGCAPAVKALIDAGSDVNKLNESGSSALMLASKAEDITSEVRLECMTHLVNAGANVKVAGEEGKQAIHFATFLGEPECTELLLKNGADASAVTSQKTPLHLVALENFPEIAEILLKYNAKLNALDGIAMTPLMYAALKHSVDVLAVLIKAGADLTQKAEGGMTALHIAAVTPDPRAEETVRLLCEAGAPMDVKDEQGMCPIHLHADFERTRCVRRLLMCGCDPDLRCDRGFTPLIRACNARNTDGDNMTLVRVLLRAGADVNAKNDNDNTVMSYLGDTKKYFLIRVMLAAGANINVRDKQGDTPLHEAAMGRHAKTVALLVRRGANVNARNDDMQTPLFIASQKGYADVVKVLLASGVGADISIGNKNGLSPYHAAREAGHDQIAGMLLDATGLRLSQFAPLTTFNNRSPRASFDAGGASDNSLRRHDSGRLLCVTCQETLRFGEEIRELPCGHAFHDPCILPWVGGEKMTNHRTCPVCKQLVAPADLFPSPE